MSSQPQPQPDPMTPPIVDPVDQPYIGPIKLVVDLTNNVDRIVTVHEEIPVAPEGKAGAKEMVLLYPQWIPGYHSPTGPISKLGGIVTTVDARRVQWVRDRANVYAFHIPLTPGAKTVSVDFQYLSPIKRTEGRIEISDKIADLAWYEVLMYPAGYFSRDIPFDTTIKLPNGWKYATALETATDAVEIVTFKTTTLDTLVDSPVYAGSNYKRVDLSPTPTDTVHLNLFADSPQDLEIKPEQLVWHKRLTAEADKLYGSHHYDHYDFLLTLSDKLGVSLEHHQSSENGHPANYFTDWAAGVGGVDLLGHEYAHSWNGKFRRPADLWTANFNVPMRDDLLWVYEGLTRKRPEFPSFLVALQSRTSPHGAHRGVE
ncbi:PDZ domain family protein [Acidisarcina polymorpha]|uniref:PDZ domain family protein n=1 Tax=Acidisarcina polymorpha TaxID=2211140 RepID=A0A2Z5G9A4_9BACT|nr:hypothetical protein [Acidisarcina polymorpha]AXC15589.1 PDZ domain family protein [Acidisarcina polymorpha]